MRGGGCLHVPRTAVRVRVCVATWTDTSPDVYTGVRRRVGIRIDAPCVLISLVAQYSCIQALNIKTANSRLRGNTQALCGQRRLTPMSTVVECLQPLPSNSQLDLT